MKNYFSLFIYLLFIWGCLDSFEPEEEFFICETASVNYFSPTNKTFIPPSKSSFIEELCVPLELEADISFFDLSASNVCLLEQYLGQATDSLNAELCEPSFTKDSLDNYHYQYVGLRMGEQDYILVNAFHETEVDSFDWKREPYLGFCHKRQKQWRILFNLEDLTFSQYSSNLINNIYFLPNFPYENLSCARCGPQRGLETFQLSKQDICLLESHFEKLKEETSIGCYSSSSLIDFNNELLLQYMGVKKNDRRWIYINGFGLRPNESKAFNEREFLWFYSWSFIPRVCDGGSIFWGVLFDLDTHEFEGLRFNTPR